MIKIRYLSLFLCVIFVVSASCRYLRIPDKKARSEFSRQDLFPHFMYMSVDHVNLHYVKVGSDTLPTLFFIHGSPGSWKGYRRYLMDTDLLKHFRIIAIDRPGFGYSNAGHAYHLSDQARLIYGIVQKEYNGKPLHLIGHSLGGPIVVKLAQDHPEAYASVTSLAGSISPYDEPKEKWRAIFVHNPLQYLLPGPFRVCNTEIWYFKKDLFEMDTCYYKMTMPVTFIHGDQDNLVTVKNVAYGTQKLSFNQHVTVILIPGANHHIPWEHYDIIKKHLLTLTTKQ
ncbi:alpha/beta fold hydrolase [Mucilaginibacter gotjawali]|uniref:Pimeloyl-ACP methyl ester carboxylesterase n=2 Tax=Mucilaginibacter gotjawali TaxID=1550579 RepID=A0A839S854_9SPHI|nr:alpha/beta hydrolase [Mucilaginibacter gotjawali]MBB3054311.1 pimeloyl-ACP methyl ester carboxylesterase [Mucilaginibacter gotjawali]BAU51853.1 4,5:9,10-diseco-3-hydroxy-5,9, 17-trioxoandrosta-1(10),2-diene-4-oate hydrolase [Mucilaginibacter gotjawali]